MHFAPGARNRLLEKPVLALLQKVVGGSGVIALALGEALDAVLARDAQPLELVEDGREALERVPHDGGELDALRRLQLGRCHRPPGLKR
jgi:hypothetical protein